MFTSQLTTNPQPFQGVTNVCVTGINTPAIALTQTQWTGVSPSTQSHIKLKFESWGDVETRQAYMEAALEQDIAWQIKLTRQSRGMSQTQLAKAIGSRQSAISRMEDPTYGKYSLPTLAKIAHAFDCALQLRLTSFSKFAEIVKNTAPESLIPASFENEKLLLGV